MTLGISRVSLSGSPSGGLRADPGADWAGYGRTFTEDHYSPLRQIDAANVAQLGLAWSLDLPGERTLEATPLAVNGVLYFSGTGGSAYAVDAITGRRLWRFDPDFAHHHPEKLRLNMGSNRGVAYWQGKVFVGAIDGRLVALDAKTGDVVWSADTLDAPDARKAITGAPRIFGNKVIIGQGGADFGTRGYVTAYDAATGKLLWRFYTVPGNPSDGFENNAMAMASRTWGGSWWHWGGGGTVWDSITYDPDLDRLYIGVGNGGPWNANIRSPGGGG
jgi:quinohemoprotein ethanol dehydrogenase